MEEFDCVRRCHHAAAEQRKKETNKARLGEDGAIHPALQDKVCRDKRKVSRDIRLCAKECQWLRRSGISWEGQAILPIPQTQSDGFAHFESPLPENSACSLAHCCVQSESSILWT